MPAARVIAELRELAARTSTADGAQRLAWGPVWRDARSWFRDKVAALGAHVTTDSAGNNWVTLEGASPKSVILGSHLDSVPNGGWLDGALGVMAGLGALRMFAGSRPPVTIAVVDWADEEGARFGRSLLGSSAAGGSLRVDDVRGLVDKEGTTLVAALAENGVALDRMLDAAEEDRPIHRHLPEVDVVAATVAGELRIRRRPHPDVGELIDRRERDAEFGSSHREECEPPEDVASTVSAWDAPGGSDGEVDLPPGLGELLGDLAA